MLEAAKAAAPPTTKVVAVTVLTSLDGDDLQSIGVDGDPAEQVERLAALARDAGLDGIVCSGAEVGAAQQGLARRLLRRSRRPARPAASIGDQKRVVTPREALDDGASILVIGRPITGADDPGGGAPRHRRDAIGLDKAAAAGLAAPRRVTRQQ